MTVYGCPLGGNLNDSASDSSQSSVTTWHADVSLARLLPCITMHTEHDLKPVICMHRKAISDDVATNATDTIKLLY